MSRPEERYAAPPDVAGVLAATGLRYGSDRQPGIARLGTPPAFRYVGSDGRPVEDARTLERIARLAVPPAWADVWISRDPDAHLQATGRDAKGRKQYRYHVGWRSERDETKFGRLAAFARVLPAIRRAIDRDLARPGLTRAKVLAAMVALLDRTAVRVGGDRYRRENGSFGLTTLRNRHASVNGDSVRLRFRGKSGKEHDIRLDDGRLARIVRRCRDLPGYELFQYREGGIVRSVDAADINEYIRQAGGERYTAKDFRTWNATVIAATALARATASAGERGGVRSVNEAVREAAAALGNTPAVCRRSYVHPAVLDRSRASLAGARRLRRIAGLSADEARVVALLNATPRTTGHGDVGRALAAALRSRRPGARRGASPPSPIGTA